MEKAFFPGQQTDERILYFTRPHVGMKYFVFGGIFLVGLFLLFAIQLVLSIVFPSNFLQLLSLILTTVITAGVIWWAHTLHEGQEIYITDRRVVKFIPTTPFHKSSRSLFWDQAVKLKTFYKNPLLQKILGVGSININAKSEADDVDIDHVILHQDLANYIDKIIYTFHNNHEELKNLHQFVPKPRGERY